MTTTQPRVIIEQKLILCGEYGVGKSSLFRRFVRNEFIRSSLKPCTIGLDFYTKCFFTGSSIGSSGISGITNELNKDTIQSQQMISPQSSQLSQQQQQQQQCVKLQLWDTGGMERVASVTSSYYKFSEGALLVFSLDSTDSFNSLSQHLIEIVSYAENAKIFICGNKLDLYRSDDDDEINDDQIDSFCEQCGTLISGVYKISCKTGQGVSEMFEDIARVLNESNKSRLELQSMGSINSMGEESFKLDGRRRGYWDRGGGANGGGGATDTDGNCTC